jgi:hypothetical protein
VSGRSSAANIDMSVVGQKTKYSRRAHVVRFASDNGHGECFGSIVATLKDRSSRDAACNDACMRQAGCPIRLRNRVSRVLARRPDTQPRVGMAACFFIPDYAARSLAKRRVRVAARGNRCLTTRFIAKLHFGHSVVSIANPLATRFRWTNAVSEPHDAHLSLCVMTFPFQTPKIVAGLCLRGRKLGDPCFSGPYYALVVSFHIQSETI